MNILVTGGAGFIGTNLIKQLIGRDHTIISLDNYSTGLKLNEIQDKRIVYSEGDVRNLSKYSHYYFSKIDLVFHLAAVARIQPSFKDPINYFETNANGTLALANLCCKNNIPIIYAGSSSHHSGKFKNPYTFSKDVGEEILELYSKCFGLTYAVARFYNVYGPNQLSEGGYTTLIGRWINNIENGNVCEIYGDGEQRRDFTHVDDIVDALISIMDKSAYGNTYELGRGKNISVNQVAKMFGINPVYKPAKPGEARNTLCNSTLAKEILGWNPQKDLVNYIKNYLDEN